MKASDLAKIQDDYTRFVQSVTFLHSLEQSRAIALEVRDISLLRLRQDGPNKISQLKLARSIGVVQQRIAQMEQDARKRSKPSDLEARFEDWIEDAQPLDV